MPLKFQAGNLLQEDAFYVTRRVDALLYEALSNLRYCCVLGPRQCGKSSLRDRTMKRLRQQDFLCANIDTNGIGSDDAAINGVAASSMDLNQFYFTVIERLVSQLNLNDAWDFWEEAEGEPVERWEKYLREELLQQTDKRVVLFVDEIDLFFQMPHICIDFFRVVRTIYEQGKQGGPFARLAFCLIGGTANWKLIQDSEMPFQIGPWLALDDFTDTQAEELLPGLMDQAENPEILLREVLAWTQGHPYHTQLLCDVLTRNTQEKVKSGDEANLVQQYVDRHFLSAGQHEDYNLKWVVKSFLPQNRTQNSSPMLHLYQRLLNKDEVVSARPDITQVDAAQKVDVAQWNPVETDLWLTGLVSVRSHCVTPRNRVFQTVFNAEWVEQAAKLKISADAGDCVFLEGTACVT